MKFNTQWQLPLLVVLLMTVNACKNRATTTEHELASLQVAENKATTATAKAATDVNTQYKYKDTPGNMTTDPVGQQEEQQSPPAGNERKQDGPPRQPAAVNPDWNKKIIKNATLSVEVKDYVRFNELVRAAVKQSGGYIAQEEQNESDYKIENSVTIKVPVDQFDNTVSALTPGKEKVLVRKITSQDVTGEVVEIPEIPFR